MGNYGASLLNVIIALLFRAMNSAQWQSNYMHGIALLLATIIMQGLMPIACQFDMNNNAIKHAYEAAM